jgi:hypothetical protein
VADNVEGVLSTVVAVCRILEVSTLGMVFDRGDKIL